MDHIFPLLMPIILLINAAFLITTGILDIRKTHDLQEQQKQDDKKEQKEIKNKWKPFL